MRISRRSNTHRLKEVGFKFQHDASRNPTGFSPWAFGSLMVKADVLNFLIDDFFS